MVEKSPDEETDPGTLTIRYLRKSSRGEHFIVESLPYILDEKDVVNILEAEETFVGKSKRLFIRIRSME